MLTHRSQNMNSLRLNRRLTGVPESVKARYRRVMRYLGLALFAALAAGAVTANVLPTSSQTQTQVAPAPQPHWTAAHAKAFPGCVGHGSFLPARIVVVAREGAAKALPYDDATIARIDATWATPSVWDDLYTIGRCAR